MVTKRDDDDDNRVNIEQSASGRWTGRVLQYDNKWDSWEKVIISNQPFKLYTHQKVFILAVLAKQPNLEPTNLGNISANARLEKSFIFASFCWIFLLTPHAPWSCTLQMGSLGRLRKVQIVDILNNIAQRWHQVHKVDLYTYIKLKWTIIKSKSLTQRSKGSLISEQIQKHGGVYWPDKETILATFHSLLLFGNPFVSKQIGPQISRLLGRSKAR